MPHSRITEIKVANLATLKNAKFVFDESGILNIKGYNDSGKSALLQGIAMNLINLIPRVQSKFIRHGADFFRVSISFDDGIEIIRDKYINGQSLYEMRKDGELVYSTKEGRTLTKVDRVPDIIADYLGLCMTENGCINYQSRRDPMFLIDTTGSRNYNDLHQVLKLEQVSRANSLANSDKNAAASEVTRLEAEVQAKELRLVDLKEVSQVLIDTMESKEEDALKLEEQKESVLTLGNMVTSIGNIKTLPKIEFVEVDRLRGILSLIKNSNELEDLPVYPKLSRVDTDRLKSISAIKGTISNLKELSKTSIPSIPQVDESYVEKSVGLSKSAKTLKELSECVLTLQDVKSELSESKKALKIIVTKARKNGHVFAKCENCGSFIKVEVGDNS